MINRYFFPAVVVLLYFGLIGFSQPASQDKREAHAPSFSDDEIQADFEAEDTVIYVGNPIAFTDLSTGNPTFHRWDFEGATPSISYSTSPTILYSNAGNFDVQLIVSGLNGSDTLLRENYIEVLPEHSGLPPGWEYSTTISQHTIVVTGESNPRIFEVPIQPGDYIGVFYEDDNNELKCGGAVEWPESGNTAVVAQGNNFFTPEKDGFDTGETFTWKLYSWEMQEEFEAKATYDPEMQLSIFVPNAISVVIDLAAGTVSQVIFPEGWSGVSSYVLPWKNNMEEIFADHLDDIELIYDGSGFFRPDQNLNSIGNWHSKGYLVKMKNEAVVDFAGYPVEDFTVQIESGWNTIHVPVNCEVQIADLLQENISKTAMVRSIAGLSIYWPDYNIFTLQDLIPGKAYQLLATDDFTISFTPCE